MSAEERWADRMEWAEEKRRGFDVEIKTTRDITAQREACNASRCKAFAVCRYEVGRVENLGGLRINLCAEHGNEETAFECYYERTENS